MTEAANLYHYTNAVGLVGILGTGKIWLGDYRSLNDDTEIKYAIELMRETLKELESKEEYKIYFEKIDWEREIVDNVIDCVGICSFCEERDSPVNWRLYAVEGGFCLGFSQEKLAKLSSKAGCHLQKVIYDKDEQVDFIKTSFTEFCKTDSIMNADIEKLRERVEIDKFFAGINLFFWAYKTAPMIKHPSFYYEREWRIYKHIRSAWDLKFHGNRGIVPYVEIELHDPGKSIPEENHWMTSLDIGPNNVDAFSKALLLIQSSGFDENKLTFQYAGIPMRRKT